VRDRWPKLFGYRLPKKLPAIGPSVQSINSRTYTGILNWRLAYLSNERRRRYVAVRNVGRRIRKALRAALGALAPRIDRSSSLRRHRYARGRASGGCGDPRGRQPRASPAMQ
jgi:hypothetical protein